MAGARPEEEDRIRRFLAKFQQVEINGDIAEIAVTIRRTHRIRLPDAIIWASAKHAGTLLVSRNIKDFPADEPGIRVPYEIH